MSLPFLLAAATVSMTPAEQITSDVRCMVTGEVLFARAPNVESQQGARALMMYYLGRVEAEVSEAELPNALSRAVKAIPKDALKSEATRCLTELQAAGDRLKAMGAKLKEQGQ